MNSPRPTSKATMSGGRPSISQPITSNTIYLGTTPSQVPPTLPPIPTPREHPALPPTLITGACGFIGKTLIRYILARHPRAKLALVDKQPPLPQYLNQENITVHQIDLTDKVAVEKLLEETRPELIIGAAGLIPGPKVKNRNIFFADNVSAVQALVEGCQSVLLEKLGLHMRGFIHTSSSDAVKGTRELAGVDERIPYPKEFFDVYSESKAQGEQVVLAANRPEFPTTCLRPHGILGAEGHIMPMMHQSLKNNETGIQIGDNKNMYDFVEVENYCAAVLLTVYNLLTVPIPPTAIGSQDLYYDYIEQGNGDENGDPISAAGHTFFITNLEPVYFWSWARRVWGWLAQGSSLSLEGPGSAQNSLDLKPSNELTPFSSNPSAPVTLTSANPLEAARQGLDREVSMRHRKSSSSFGAAIRTATAFSFSATPPLPALYKPYSPPPPPFPESNKFHEQAPVKIPKAVGLALAYAAECFATTVRGKDPGLTRVRIQECCYNRWFRGDKAGHVLGYWGGLAPDSKGYGMGGIGLWYSTKRACYHYLQILEKTKQASRSGTASFQK